SIVRATTASAPSSHDPSSAMSARTGSNRALPAPATFACARVRSAWLVNSDKHASSAKPSQNAPAESTRSTPQFDDAVSGVERDLVEESFGGIREMRILNLKATRGLS